MLITFLIFSIFVYQTIAQTCDVAPASKYCLFTQEGLPIVAREKEACEFVNEQEPLPLASNPTACELAKSEQPCVDLLRSMGCSRWCQNCTEGLIDGLPICKDICDELVEGACKNADTVCGAGSKPWQFLCAASSDEPCVRLTISGQPGIVAPTVPPPVCVTASPPAHCLYDSALTLHEDHKPACDDANGVPIAPNPTDQCGQALLSDVSCQKTMDSLTCSRRCQECEQNGTTLFVPLQICKPICDNLLLNTCTIESRTKCAARFLALCADEGEECSNELIYADVEVPTTTNAPTTTTTTTTPSSSSSSSSSAPLTTTNIDATTSSSSTVSSSNGVSDQTTTASNAQSTTTTDSLPIIDVDSDKPAVSQQDIDYRLGFGIGIPLFFLLIVGIFIWACQPKKE